MRAHRGVENEANDGSMAATEDEVIRVVRRQRITRDHVDFLSRVRFSRVVLLELWPELLPFRAS